MFLNCIYIIEQFKVIFLSLNSLLKSEMNNEYEAVLTLSIFLVMEFDLRCGQEYLRITSIEILRKEITARGMKLTEEFLYLLNVLAFMCHFQQMLY